MAADVSERIVDFEISIGLPVTFEDLNLKGITRDRLRAFGELCTAKGSFCENHPFEVTAERLVDAMVAADALGRDRRSRARKIT